MNEYGQVAMREWINTGTLRPNIELDTYVVMPNHLHGMLVINDCTGGRLNVGAYRNTPLQMHSDHHHRPSVQLSVVLNPPLQNR